MRSRACSLRNCTGKIFNLPADPIVFRLVTYPPPTELLRDRLVKVLYGEAGLLYFLAELNEFHNLGKGLGR